MNFDDLKNIIGLVATVVGIVAGAYALYQNHEKSKATKEQEEATEETKQKAKLFEDRAAAVEALQSAITAQAEVIAGLTNGLAECIKRDNAKATEIEELRIELRTKVEALSNEITELKASRGQ